MFSKKTFDYKYLGKGLIVCLLFTIVALIILGLLLKLTSLSEAKLPMFNNLIIIISVSIGAVYASSKSRENGWLIGALIGLIYYLFIVLLNLIFIRDINLSLIIIPRILMSVFSGIIGGVIGINLY